MINMKRVLVTGGNGQLGNALKAIASHYPSLCLLFTDVQELDLTDSVALAAFVKDQSIDYVLNCAAYTAVDKAEDESELCDLVNHIGVKNIGEVASRFGVKVIHISTDYVFDGTNYKPYVETDRTAPASVYGNTKLEGEKALFEACFESIVIRTSWLYSEYGNNFVKTMLRLGTEREELRVVFDQVGTPTYAGDLASAMLTIAAGELFVPGIYHFSNEGVCSWYDFTIRIHQLADIQCRVLPVESSEYPTKAKRPHYSVLNKSKIKNTYQLTIPYWEESLRKVISYLTK